MVFLTALNFVRTRGPDQLWKKRKILKLSAFFYGRRRNCYTFALRSVHRALVYSTKSRQLKKEDMKELWNQRINAGSNEHGLQHWEVVDALHKNNILINRKTLADLAIWEPSSFEALSAISQAFKVPN